MSTYFNVVNLDKKEQAILVIVKTQQEADATIAKWNKEKNKDWFLANEEDFNSANAVWDSEQFIKNADSTWTYDINPYFRHNQKKVFGHIFYAACADQWGNVSSWFGDRIVVICDTHSTNDMNSPISSHDFMDICDTYKKVKFFVSYSDWMDK